MRPGEVHTLWGREHLLSGPVGHLYQRSPTCFGTGDRFCGGQVSHGPGRGWGVVQGGFGMTQVCFFCLALLLLVARLLTGPDPWAGDPWAASPFTQDILFELTAPPLGNYFNP